MKTQNEIELLMLQHMKHWPLYQADYSVFAIALVRGWSLGYTSPRPRRPYGTYWDANIIGETFYLLDICIGTKWRGKGHGEQLYDVLTTMAQSLGCSQIRQTPSGNAYGGESRRDWLLRRLWTNDGSEVFKILPTDDDLRRAREDTAVLDAVFGPDESSI